MDNIIFTKADKGNHIGIR